MENESFEEQSLVGVELERVASFTACVERAHARAWLV